MSIDLPTVLWGTTILKNPPHEKQAPKTDGTEPKKASTLGPKPGPVRGSRNLKKILGALEIPNLGN